MSWRQHFGMRTHGDEDSEADTAEAEHSAGRPQALPHTDCKGIKSQGVLCLGSLLIVILFLNGG